MNAVVQMQPAANVDAYRASTDAASLCKEIVVATASNIQGRRFVSVEGWQAIAIAHGCAASARDVEKIDGGVRAIGEIRRMSDGAILSMAEGFVGEDEETWYGGKNRYGKVLPKRNDYAIRAMAQTRAISRACRSAFAHVVVMMNAGLSTTPAEEVPEGGFDNDRAEPTKAAPTPPSAPAFITDEQRHQIMTLATAKNIDARMICEKAGIDAIKNMPAAWFDKAMAWLAKQPKRELEPAGGSQGDDILNDDIPY